jgi:hypothetical protein
VETLRHASVFLSRLHERPPSSAAGSFIQRRAGVGDACVP